MTGRLALTIAVGSLATAALVALAPGSRSPDAATALAIAAGQRETLRGATITIDPGHNGDNASHPDRINRLVSIGNGETKACDTTGTETAAGYPESRFNLSVARKLKRMLKRRGAKVVMTRRSDDGVGPCIDKRARIGNRARSDAAVSIHADGGPPSGRGFHVIHPSKIRGLTDDIHKASRRLARDLRRSYKKRTGIPPSTYVGSHGLDERSDLGGLRLSDVPKVFIETGNMRNARDARKLESAKHRKRIARAIRAGLARFLRR